MYQGLDLDNYWDGYADPAEPSSGSGRSGLTGSTPNDLQLALQNQDYGDTGLFTPSYNSGGSYLDTGQGFGVLGLFTPPFRREVAIYDTVHETQCHMDHSGIHVGIQTTQRRHCSLHGTSYRTSGVHMSVGNGGIGIRSFATSGGGSAGRRRGIFGQSNDYPDTGYSDDPYHVDDNYYGANSYSETDEQQGPIITEVDDSEEDESFESNRAIEYKQQSSFTETVSRQNSETEVGETRDTKRINKNEAMARSFTRPKNKNTLPERKRSNSETSLQAQNDKTDTTYVTKATTTPTFQLTEDDTIQQTKASHEIKFNKDTLNGKTIKKSTSQFINSQQDVPTLSLGETLDLSVVQQSEDQDYDNERQIDNILVEESFTKAESNPTDTVSDYRSCMGSQDNKLEDESEDKNTNLSALNVKPFEVGNNGNTVTKQELYNSVDSGFPTSNVKPDKETVITDARPQNKNSLPQRKTSTFESISELEYDIRNNKNAIESSDTRSNVEVTFPTNRPIEDNTEEPPLISNEESHHIGDNMLHELNSDDMPVNDDQLSESTIQFSFFERNDIENTDELSVLNEFQTCDVLELQQAESQDDENDNEPVMEVEKEDRDSYTQAVELSKESSKTQNITTIQEISNFVSSDIPNSVEKHDKLIVDVGIIQNESVSNINPDLIGEEDINNARTIGTTPVSSEVPNTFPLSDNASKTKSRKNRVSRTLGLSKTHILSIDGSEGVHHSTDQNHSDNGITNTDEKDDNERNIDIFKTGDTDNKDKSDKTIPGIPDKEQSFSRNKDDGLKDTQNSNAFDQSFEPALNCDSGDEDEFKSLVTNDRISASKTSIGSSRTSFTNNNYTNNNNVSHELYLVAEANKPYNEMMSTPSSIRNANMGLNLSNSYEGTSDPYRQRKTVKEIDNRYAYQDDLPTNSSLRNERPTNLKLIQIFKLREKTHVDNGTGTEFKSEILKSANERLKRTNDKDKITSYANNFDNDHFEGLTYQQNEIQSALHDQTKSTFQSNTSYGFDLNSDAKGKDCVGTSDNAAESTTATSNNHQVNWKTNKDPSTKTSVASTDEIRTVFNSVQRTDYVEPSPERIDKTLQNDTNQTTPEKQTFVTDTNANKRDVYMNSDYVKDFKWEYPSHGTTSTLGDYKRSDSYPRNYNRGTSNMSEKVAKAGLVLKDVHPDGNCLFAAVVDQLRVRGEFFYTARTLRRTAVTYLREHPRQDDGTELVSYLTDFDGTWDQYLRRMSREGEWGDHLVISAIANILQRRLVIMNNTSDKPTIQIPERPKHSLPQQAIQGDAKEASPAYHDLETSQLSDMGNLEEQDVDASKAKNKIDSESNTEASESDQKKLSSSEVKTSEPENTAIDKDEVAAGFEYDDLHLGHISEAHYVSLRHHDWEKKLYNVLSTKTTSCFLSYGHDEQLKTSDLEENPDLSTREFGEFEYHMMYALKYSLINGAIVCPNNVREETLIEGERTDNVTKVKNNKSTLTPYSPLHDELYSFICHLDENKFWTKYGKMVGQTNYSKDISVDIKCQIHPNDTKVVIEYNESNEICSKDLLIDDAHSKAGYTKLIPVDSAIWMHRKVKEDGQYYLKNLPLKGIDNEMGTFSFRSEWPLCAKGWINRPRKHNWPQLDVIKRVELETCRVTTSQDTSVSYSGIEWKFAFDDAEKILIKSLNEDQKSCFHVVRPLIEHTMGTHFSYQHLRHVFYYVCEELEPELWLRRPVIATCTVVQRFQSCYKSENLPNYFVAEDNMIEMMSKATLATIVDRLDILIKNMFIMFYFALDEHNQIHFSLFPMFDDVIEDIQHFAGHRSLERSFDECFLPLTIEGLVLLANQKSFAKLLTQTDKALVDLNSVAPIKLTTERLLLRVVERTTPKTVQWLCSFFLDQKLGTMFIESVFSGEETVSISEYFGSELMECLERIHDGNIRIPVELTYVECLPGVVLLFLATLKEELKINVSIVCKGLDYFLSHHKERIVNAMTNTNLNAEVRQICKFQIKTLQLLLDAENIKEISDEMNRKMKKAKEAVESTKRLLLLAEQHLNGGNVKEAREILLRLKKMPQSENE